MVTVLPFDDDELVYEGLAIAAAVRVERGVQALNELSIELRTAQVIDRAKWEAAYAELARLRGALTPVLEYARCFADQWPEDAEDGR